MHPCPQLGEEHVYSALEGSGCVHCGRFPPHTLQSCLALFTWPCVCASWLSFASAKAAWRLRSWGSQMELAEAEQETGSSFSLVLSPDSDVRISLLRELVYIRNLL